MAKQLKKYFTSIDQIGQGKVINSWHVSQSIDAFTGADYYDIKISGSLEVIGDMYLDLKDEAGSTLNYKYLGVDLNTNKLGYYTFDSQIAPLEVDAGSYTAWNNGPGNLNSNTSFGQYTFISNTTGVGNTVIGSSNLNTSTTGYNNTILGYDNMSKGVNPYYNIAVGIQTLYNNNSNNNIGIGVQALYTNTTGNSNVALGNKSLYFNLTGSNNLSLGAYSLYNNKGSNNVALGFESSKEDINGSNRVSIGAFSGKISGSNYLEIHSYVSPTSPEKPLILGKFDEGWLQINGNLRLDLAKNPPPTSINTTPTQLLFDVDGKAYTSPRGYTQMEADQIFQTSGSYSLVGTSYTKAESNSKFYNGDDEFLTSLLAPVLTGNVLTIKYTGEDGLIQQQNVDLSSLSTVDIHIDGVSWDSSSNVLTLTDSLGETFTIDLSEFQLLVTINPDGTSKLTQEGVDKLILSKVARTGLFADILSKPTTTAGYGIIDAITIGATNQTKSGNLTVNKIITNGGTAGQFVKGDGSLDSSVYITSAGLTNYVTLNTTQTITGVKTFDVVNTTDWLFPKHIALNDSVGTITNKVGILLDNNDFKINWRNNTNTYLYELLSINGVTKTATFGGNVVSNRFITTGGTANQFVKGDGTLDSLSYIPTTHVAYNITQQDIDSWVGGTGSSVNGVTFTATAFTIHQAVGDVVKVVPTFNQNTTGNAATATRLATARTINGTSFNGTADITTIKWGTARNITIGNSTKSVDGSSNLSWTVEEIGISASSHDHDDRYYTETEINDFIGGTSPITGYNKAQWDSAYTWGNHSTVGYVPGTRTITINGTTYNLSSNVSFTIPNTTYVAGSGLNLTTNTFSINFGTTTGTVAAGNDSRFHDTVTLGTSNGLSLNGQELSLALASSTTPGVMSVADKVKLDTLVASKNGTVTSVNMTVPTGFTTTGTPITSSGTIAIGMASGYKIPTITSQSKWDTASTWGDHNLKGYITAAEQTQTTLDPITLVDTTLSIKYTGESGIQQVRSIDLSTSVGDKHYTHDQAMPSSAWSVTHNLNKKPSVTITDTAGTEVEGSITHTNNNQLVINFNYPFSGYAELN